MEQAPPPTRPPLSAEPVEPASTELAALLALTSLDELGPNRLRALLCDENNTATASITSTTSAQQALATLRQPFTQPNGQPTSRPNNQLAALCKCKGVTADHLHRWAAALRQTDESALLQHHHQAGIHIETPAQISQNPLWSNDPEPPLMLFRQGKPVRHESRRVGIVGTRRCSGYGKTVAARLGEDLARAGITIVSGLASGIDGAAQRAAHHAGGDVIGVIASGLDMIYPPSNTQLWRDIAKSGTLLSEYPLGAKPLKWRFPARNRLIAALSEVVIVVESGSTGGSFYTVDAAAERDVPVMAVPGPITARSSQGTNALLADGCAVVRDIDDILLALDLTASPIPASSDLANPAQPDQTTLDLPDQPNQLETKLLDQLVANPATIDDLITELTIAAQETAGQPDDANLTSDANPGLAQVALALDRLRQTGWVVESGGWWERVR